MTTNEPQLLGGGRGTENEPQKFLRFRDYVKWA